MIWLPISYMGEGSNLGRNKIWILSEGGGFGTCWTSEWITLYEARPKKIHLTARKKSATSWHPCSKMHLIVGHEVQHIYLKEDFEKIISKAPGSLQTPTSTLKDGPLALNHRRRKWESSRCGSPFLNFPLSSKTKNSWKKSAMLLRPS